MEPERRSVQPAAEMARATPALLVAVSAVYIGLSLAVWQLADPAISGAPWWPAAGLTLAVLCRVQRRDWPRILAVIFASDLLADQLEGIDLATSCAWATANTIEPLLGALALRRVFQGHIPNFESPRNTIAFFATSALAGPPIASLIGAAASAISFDQDFLITWRDWYVGDVLGIVVVAPVILYSHQLRKMINAQFVFTLVLTTAFALLIFRGPVWASEPRPYLITPLLIYVVFRFGAPGAAAAGLIIAVIADLMSALGYGPFALVAENPNALIDLQLFTAVQLVTVYLLASVRSLLMVTTAEAELLSEEKLRDPLTDAGNRMLLERALFQATAEPSVGSVGEPAAVLFLDLDEFKPINDTFGHEVGDDVLREVARRIQATVRDSDTVARVGGDEFAIVCRNIERSAADALAGRIERAVEQPIRAGNQSLSVSPSVGVGWTAGPTGDPDGLLREADRAMYAVKASRRGPARSTTRPGRTRSRGH